MGKAGMMDTLHRMVLILAAQQIQRDDAMKQLRKELDAFDAPDKVCDPVYEPSRKRAQWKNETNYRGRNR